MRRRRLITRKHYILFVFLFLLLGIGIGYAALQKDLKVTGSSTIEKQSWDLHFESVEVTSGSVTATKPATITPGNLTEVTYDVTLDSPGQFYEFTVEVVNGGTLDAKLSKTPTLTGLSTEQDAYLNCTATWDDSTQIKASDRIAGQDRRTAKVRIEYDSNASEFPTAETSLTLNFTLNFVQG